MEFEKNAPVTAEDVALADAPRLNLQPMHGEVKAEQIDTPHSAQVGTFAFDAESTSADTDTSPEAAPASDAHPHKATALLVATGCVVVFGGLVAFVYFSR